MKRGATIIGAPPYFVSSYEFSRSVVKNYIYLFAFKDSASIVSSIYLVFIAFNFLLSRIAIIVGIKAINNPINSPFNVNFIVCGVSMSCR